MRLLFFSPYFYPHVSGLTTLPLAVLTHWSKRHQIRVLTFAHRQGLPPQESYQGLMIERLPYQLKLHKGFVSGSSLSRFAQAVKAADLVITNLPNAEGWPLTALARRRGLPILAIYHCQVTLPAGPANRLVNFGLNAAVTAQLRSAALIIGTSQDYLDHTSQIRPFLSKCQAISPPVSPLAVNPTARGYFKKQKQASRWVGFVGRLSGEKGLDSLVTAITVLPPKLQVRLVTAGPDQVVGETRSAAAFSRALGRYHLPHRHFGFLPADRLGAFYQALDVLVLPSTNPTEAFGQVQLEAMFAGTPVVASDLPGVRVPVTLTGMGRLCRPQDSASLAHVLEKILTHRQAYTGPAQIKRLHQNFNYQASLASYDQVLSSLAR